MTAAPPSFALDAQEKQDLLERFLRYARINTRSREDAETFPSTDGQWELLQLLESELRELEVDDVRLDDHGYLFATIPSNLPEGKTARTVGLLAHVDTYAGTSADGVHPIVHEDYDGGDIPLPGDPDLVIRASENPLLALCKGHSVVTSDGTTLLGADDKAGVAAIMTLVDWLRRHPEVPHGRVRVGFTPDEEIGQGTKFFDVERFGAAAAYTLDGSELGEVENETFCAHSAILTLTGVDIHPGYAKGKMVSAIRAAAHVIENLPRQSLPETTEKRESYLHPIHVEGDVGKAVVKLIVRGFTDEDVAARESDLQRLAKDAETAFPGLRAVVEIKESYRNMKVVLDENPEVTERAIEAVKRAGVEPKISPIRGGTDGAVLCFKGLPTPNLFAGGVNFHGLKEWVSLEWMAKSAETALHLVHLWGEQG